MRMRNISKLFNNDKIYDGYDDTYLFDAHTTAHDDKTSSGATARRRIMRTAPETVPPARRVIRLYDNYWIVGNSNLDSYSSEGIRRSYGLKQSTGLMALLTPAGAVTAAQGTPLHTQKEFYRDTVNPTTESDLSTFYNIFCPFTEPVTVGSFLRQGAALYRVRNVYPTVDQYLVAESDEFDADALTVAHFTANGPRDLVTDKVTVVDIAVPALQFEDVKFYRFADEAEAGRKPGDKAVFVPASAITVSVGAKFTMLGQRWVVASVAHELDVLALQVRLG